MENKKVRKKSSVFLLAVLMVMFAAVFAVVANALTDTVRPTIVSVTPINSEKDLSRSEQVTVVFSEYMNPSTINADTFKVMQRTTPEFGNYESRVVAGTVTYSDLTATFVPTNPLSPNQHYGNVFTVTVTDGVKDLEGNSISQDYMWSFTTGGDAFNTGTSTSQLDQSSATISEPVVVPVVTAPVETAPVVTPVTTQAAKANWYTSIWFFSGIVALLLIALLITFALINPANKKDKTGSQATRPNPFGDVHPVMDLEGIGPKYSKGLNAMGIRNTKQLWGADAVKIARGTGASVGLVKSWQHMAELASVKDIGPQYAELLERSGVHTIGQLKNCNATELLNLVREKEDSLKINIQGNTPGHALVENWIEEAKDHKFTDPQGQTA